MRDSEATKNISGKLNSPWPYMGQRRASAPMEDRGTLQENRLGVFVRVNGNGRIALSLLNPIRECTNQHLSIISNIFLLQLLKLSKENVK